MPDAKLIHPLIPLFRLRRKRPKIGGEGGWDIATTGIGKEGFNSNSPLKLYLTEGGGPFSQVLAYSALKKSKHTKRENWIEGEDGPERHGT